MLNRNPRVFSSVKSVYKINSVVEYLHDCVNNQTAVISFKKRVLPIFGMSSNMLNRLNASFRVRVMPICVFGAASCEFAIQTQHLNHKRNLSNSVFTDNLLSNCILNLVRPQDQSICVWMRITSSLLFDLYYRESVTKIFRKPKKCKSIYESRLTWVKAPRAL